MNSPELKTLEVNGMTIGYREAGSGPAVLLIHGWPTHSWLWRDVMPAIAKNNRVIAIDLPGFGASSKPLKHRYGFSFYDGIISGFLEQLEIDRVALGVHDLGGPIGLHWAISNPDRVERIALLNTLAYPQVSNAVKIFVAACSLPIARDILTSRRGVTWSMRFGVADKSNMDDEAVKPYTEPFEDRDARRALADTAKGLGAGGFKKIEAGLGELDVPFRIVYGTGDKILPDVAETMARVNGDVAQCQTTPLEGVGHFLQEERGAEIGELLAPFFAPAIDLDLNRVGA